jgi:hypothetical protein
LGFKEVLMMMTTQMLYPASTLVTAVIPAELIVAPLYAWALVLGLLALCCAGLWFLAESGNAAEKKDSRSSRRARPGVGRHRSLHGRRHAAPRAAPVTPGA